MQSDNLKWVAILLMLIDHVGLYFFPETLTWRLVGRLAFPLFAYQLAVGYNYTRNHLIQLRNLMAFAIISQTPYLLVVRPETWTFNIFFTLGLGYLLMMAYSKKKWLFAMTLLLLGCLLPLDYGIYGVALPLIFHHFRTTPLNQSIGFGIATVLYSLLHSPYQLYALFAVLILWLIRFSPDLKIKTSKWFFYAFYPIHLTLLVLIGSYF